MHRLTQIYFLIQRPRLDTNPLGIVRIVMKYPDTTASAKSATTNPSRIAFTLKITKMLLGGWGELEGGRGNDEAETECGCGLALTFEAVADVQGVGFRGDGIGDVAALAAAGEVGALGGAHIVRGRRLGR